LNSARNRHVPDDIGGTVNSYPGDLSLSRFDPPP
jgi:hypothetical protein